MINHQALFDTLMTSTGEAVLVAGADGNIVRVSKSFEQLTGIPATELLEQPVEQLCKGNGQHALREALSAGEIRTSTVVLAGNGNTWNLQLQPILEKDQPAGGIIILRPDQGGMHHGGFDDLTGLPNRHLFDDRLRQALNTAQRGKKLLVIMLTALDRFGEISDVFGDQSGKQVLQDIADRFRQLVRTNDTVARLENERFAFVMEIAATGDSVLLAEKILGAFEQPFLLDSQKDVAITCSIGISIYPADGSTPEELVQNAAIALHHVKDSDHNRYQFFSGEMNTKARHRIEIEGGIRRALNNQEFVVYYQPKIDPNQHRMVGMEALVRWRDPERGMISPGEFIPIAEESGLIEQIGQWVLEEACAQNHSWQMEGLPPVCASVNVSARQFRRKDFVSTVEQALSRSGLEAQWLELEITESMLMSNVDELVARMDELRRLGVSLSIDDFGTGYSSLSYLSRFPITTLKIDRAFVVDVQSNPHTAEIARAIIGLSRGLKLEVVAEGAEVIEQVDFLKEHGCNLVQGYFYSKPLPAEEFANLLRNGLRAP